ncbi:MAG: 2-oxoacid:ferredoxin oxidoreductase subunit beta [Armatimonadota bacterium]
MPKSQAIDHKYLRQQYFPHIWCAGCGHGIVLSGALRAIAALKLEQDKVAVISGIGCSSRVAGYLDFNTLHTTHGRALAFATGVKLAKPELTVIVATGDGDAAAIGGNHLIHAARRNIDITCICFNNHIYGMTSGQYSPTTPFEARATTAPYGNLERPFDLCKLAAASGATYVARTTTYHAPQLAGLLRKGIQNSGFSFIDVISGCPTYYGRRNDLRTATALLEWQRDNSVTLKDAESMAPEALEGKYIIGELVNRRAPEYCAVYDQLIARLQERAG